MGRHVLTQARVFEAADRMVAANLTPTLALVRQELGGGSFTTISQHMHAWRKAREEETEVVGLATPPKNVLDAAMGVGRLAWSLAYRQAQNEYKSERAAWQQEKLRLEERIIELETALDSMRIIENTKG